MRRDDVADIFQRLPDTEHARVHVIMRAGPVVSIDSLIRLQPHYAVIRGREAGNQAERRVCFVPYDDMVCMKLERVVKNYELDEWFRDTEPMSKRDDEEPPAPGSVQASEPVTLDPSEIARQNLLERIRAARSIATKK